MRLAGVICRQSSICCAVWRRWIASRADRRFGFVACWLKNRTILGPKVCMTNGALCPWPMLLFLALNLAHSQTVVTVQSQHRSRHRLAHIWEVVESAGMAGSGVRFVTSNWNHELFCCWFFWVFYFVFGAISHSGKIDFTTIPSSFWLTFHSLAPN